MQTTVLSPPLIFNHFDIYQQVYTILAEEAIVRTGNRMNILSFHNWIIADFVIIIGWKITFQPFFLMCSVMDYQMCIADNIFPQSVLSKSLWYFVTLLCFHLLSLVDVIILSHLSHFVTWKIVHIFDFIFVYFCFLKYMCRSILSHHQMITPSEESSLRAFILLYELLCHHWLKCFSQFLFLSFCLCKVFAKCGVINLDLRLCS